MTRSPESSEITLGLANDPFPRLLPHADVSTLAAHLDHYGPMPVDDRLARGHLIHAVEQSGLRGRGGAAFPTAVKMSAVAARRRAGVVVANGTEGEPTSAKDKALLGLSPHLVLDGAVASAVALGAREVVLCVERATYPSLGPRLEAALAERRAARIDSVKVSIEWTPSRFVAGEESALVHWLNGGEAKPTVVPPRPFERGVDSRPTLVQNVETLADVALIARFGSGWFRSLGTEDDPGSALVTVSGAVARPGVFEVEAGSALVPVIEAAGGSWAELDALLVGGYFGTWVPISAAAQVDLGTASLRSVGASLACGILVAFPRGACGLAESARITRWAADQNAGQCGPCVNGLDAIARAMAVLVSGDHEGSAERHLARWLDMVKGRGACKHPDGVARFVESSLRVFAPEIAVHRRLGPCRHDRPLLPLPAGGGWR